MRVAWPLGLMVIGCAAPAQTEGGTDCRTSAGSYYVMRGSGSGFDAYESETLVAVTSTSARGIVCTSTAPATIVAGSFAVEITNPWDGFSAYPRFGAFLDRNGNTRCDDDEPAWTSVRILLDGICTGQLSASEDAGGCGEL